MYITMMEAETSSCDAYCGIEADQSLLFAVG